MDASTTLADDLHQQTITSDSYLNISYSSHHSQQQQLLDDCKTSTTLLSAKELNDALPFFHETLELSQEDIQKTLSANMPLGRGPESATVAGNLDTSSIVHDNVHCEINPMDFIDNVTGGVDVPSVHDDDVFVNLDAFDMFVEFPELDLDAKNTLLQTNHDMDIVGDVHTYHDSNSNELHTQHLTLTDANDLALQPITQSLPNADLYDISDYSPEWAYPEGGIKVLVTGPWDINSIYTVLFDSVPVPTTLVQTGVLRCYCPAHEVGLATIQVACRGIIISNSCIFEYKSPVNGEQGTGSDGMTSVTTGAAGSNENLYKLNLYNRLECIDERLQIKTEPSDNVSANYLLMLGQLI